LMGMTLPVISTVYSSGNKIGSDVAKAFPKETMIVREMKQMKNSFSCIIFIFLSHIKKISLELSQVYRDE